jgi:hypothetical protein
MKVLRKISEAAVVCFLATTLHAQTCTISGKIIDSKTEEPLPQANVFINNSTIGTVSDIRGDFVLSNVRQPATYELVISFIGYASYKTKLSLSSNQLNIGTVHLIPAETELIVSEPKASRDVEWEKNLKKFKKIFIGADKAAAECVILNPQVIDFQNNLPYGRMIATASAPIEIENKTLGYRVTFYLSTFEAGSTDHLIKGNVRFEFSKPANAKMLALWEQNREILYNRSRQHLIKAIVDNRINGEGFNLYKVTPGFEHSTTQPQTFKDELGRTVVVFDTVNMATSTTQKDIYRIALKGRLEIHYTKERASNKVYNDIGYPVSWMTFTGSSILVNKEGVPVNPSEIAISGAMGNVPVAQMLPFDYLPLGILFKMSKNEEYGEAMNSFYEKIYVHTDKSYYYPGETLWFKGYVNYSNPTMRDSLSRTVYAEFIHGPTNKVVLSKILHLDSGTFQSDFILPDTLTSSDCYLRAYTNLNRNYGDDRLYLKSIPVLTLLEKPESIRTVISTSSGSLKITPDKTNYNPREKITLSIQVQSEDKDPVAANLSVSVTDASRVVLLEGTTILSDFPMHEIPRAKYFSWPAEYGIGFAAKIKNGTDKPMKETVNIFQLSPKNFFVSETDIHGVFSLTNLNFYDTSNFSFQTVKGKKQVFRDVELLQTKLPSFVYQPSPRLFNIVQTQLPQRQESVFELLKNTRLLKEVTVKSTKIVEPDYERPYGRPDYVIKSTDINTSYGNLLLTMQGKVPGLIVRQANNPRENFPRWVVYLQRSATSSISNAQEVTVLVNNAVMGGTPGDVLGSIDPSTIESIEVTTRLNSLFGGLGCCGVINIFTKRGGSQNNEGENTPHLRIRGYARLRKFIAPDYSIVKPGEIGEDQRSLLYWNPTITTNSRSGAATASFFASDNEGQYRVIVEGVTEGGKPVHGEYLIKVSR